jgi:translation elongation factor EF-Ts
MACKKALVSSNGDINQAAEILRKEFSEKIDVANYQGKQTGIYCVSGFIGNILENNGAECSVCRVFVNEKDIINHKCT